MSGDAPTTLPAIGTVWRIDDMTVEVTTHRESSFGSIGGLWTFADGKTSHGPVDPADLIHPADNGATTP